MWMSALQVPWYKGKKGREEARVETGTLLEQAKQADALSQQVE